MAKFTKTSGSHMQTAAGRRTRQKEDSTQFFSSILETEEKIHSSRKKAAVVFCDLVGSTQVKIERGDLVGLKRTYVHNKLISDLAAKHRGVVVKYIGDECMLLFSGNSAINDAFQAAITVQSRLRQLNSEKSGDIWPLETKIGINFGEVLFWQYNQKAQPDPQGVAVDIAARLTSLAKPNQILTTLETQNLRGTPRIPSSAPEQRCLKGFTKPLNVVEIYSDKFGWGIPFPPYLPESEKNVRPTILEVIDLESQEKFETALKLLRETLKTYPASFLTHFYIGRICDRVGMYDEALTNLRMAQNLNPNNPAPWLHDAVIEWKKAASSNGGEIPDAVLKDVISKTSRCFETAITKLDYGHMRRSKQNLAYFYALEKGSERLPNAEKICIQLLKEVELEGTKKKAQFLEVYAAVLMKKGTPSDLQHARTLLKEAHAADENNSFVIARMLEHRKQHQ